MDEPTLEKLWARIPEVNCKESCCDCCTPFLWSDWEEAERKNTPVAQELRCKCLVKGRCSIYDQRPVICRLFGASEDSAFHCPHGRIAANPLREDETKKIMAQWFSLSRDEEVD